ncbi:CoA-transferase [Streptomyces sp. NPDC048496]|uniref:CoA-transferase n=1 Tax=Streptomyces sp. NPDC048496 TaxID=3365558 RepID=UPI0037204DE5
MTIGIGGWGSRRKPMALVRALLRSGITDLTVISYGGPDVGLHAHGSVWKVVPRTELMHSAMELAGEIARKDGHLIRLAKAAINGIDPVDVRRSYRFEQGFTFEANLSGIAGRVRDTFGKEARP